MSRLLGQQVLVAASPIPVRSYLNSSYGHDLNLATLEAALVRIDVQPGGAAVLVIGFGLLFTALRIKKELPETIGLGVTSVAIETNDQIFGYDWLLVGPTGIALYNPGSS